MAVRLVKRPRTYRSRDRAVQAFDGDADAPAVDRFALRPALGDVTVSDGPDEETQSETTATVTIAA